MPSIGTLWVGLMDWVGFARPWMWTAGSMGGANDPRVLSATTFLADAKASGNADETMGAAAGLKHALAAQQKTHDGKAKGGTESLLCPRMLTPVS